MARGVTVPLLLLSMLLASVCLEVAADSTIQNVSSSNMKVNGKLLKRGAIVKLRIANGKTTLVTLEFSAILSGIRLENNRQYFVVDNQFNTVDFGDGKIYKLLDLVKGTVVANSF